MRTTLGLKPLNTDDIPLSLLLKMNSTMWSQESTRLAQRFLLPLYILRTKYYWIILQGTITTTM